MEMQRSMHPSRDTTSNLLDEEDEDVATQQPEITNRLSTQQFILVAKGRRGIKRCQAGRRRGEDHKIGMKRTPPWHPPLPSFSKHNKLLSGRKPGNGNRRGSEKRERGKGKDRLCSLWLVYLVVVFSLLNSTNYCCE